MNLQEQEQFFQMMARLKANSGAASSVPKADVLVTEMINGVLVSKPAKKIEHLKPASMLSE